MLSNIGRGRGHRDVRQHSRYLRTNKKEHQCELPQQKLLKHRLY